MNLIVLAQLNFTKTQHFDIAAFLTIGVDTVTAIAGVIAAGLNGRSARVNAGGAFTTAGILLVCQQSQWWYINNPQQHRGFVCQKVNKAGKKLMMNKALIALILLCLMLSTLIAVFVLIPRAMLIPGFVIIACCIIIFAAVLLLFAKSRH